MFAKYGPLCCRVFCALTVRFGAGFTAATASSLCARRLCHSVPSAPARAPILHPYALFTLPHGILKTEKKLFTACCGELQIRGFKTRCEERFWLRLPRRRTLFRKNLACFPGSLRFARNDRKARGCCRSFCLGSRTVISRPFQQGRSLSPDATLSNRRARRPT